MMNYIWPFMIIFSFVSAIIKGNLGEMSTAIITSGNEALNLIIKLTGIICLWNGIINISKKSGLTKIIAKLLNPILKILFPKLKDKQAKEAIAMNITANLLGIDNAATPLGINVMNRLQKLNENKLTASDDMVKFVVINTASIQLIPSTVLLLRQEYGSLSPTEIILPSIFTASIALLVGLIMTTLLKRSFK